MQLAAGLLVAVLLAWAPACGSSGVREDRTPAEETEKPMSEEGKSWGGWRWQGKRQHCFFLYDNHCFAELERACLAARCSERGKTCIHDAAAPAHVSCESGE